MFNDPLKSISGWATQCALDFRNPPEPVKKVEDGQPKMEFPKRNCCATAVRIAIVEFPVIPLLIVASLVEGVFRGVVGVTIVGLGLGASALIDFCGTSEPAWLNTGAYVGIAYLAAPGYDTLLNVGRLFYFFVHNISHWGEELEVEAIEICNSPA